MHTAMTVLGKVPVKDLGFTLSHEHLVMGNKTDSVWHVDPSEIPGMYRSTRGRKHTTPIVGGNRSSHNSIHRILPGRLLARLRPRSHS